MDFTNKVVLITGASRGIGRACAVQFARAGAIVAVNYVRNVDMANETLELLEGDAHFLLQGDVSQPEEARRMVDVVVQKAGKIDIVVNNAGIYEECAPDKVTYTEWQDIWTRIIATNLTGAANLAYCASQYMMRRGGGRIVNVSSRGAFRGEPDSPAYGASKAGMNAMGQSLAKALAPHKIFVGTVAPGWVETEMAEEHLRGVGGDEIRNQSPLKRVATVDEVAYAVLFLASDGAEFTTGTIIDVNGASYLRS